MMKACDPKCGELAEYFLEDSPHNTEDHRKALASAIQEAVEDWFAEAESSKAVSN